MLDPWIIEQIRKREEEQRRPHERPAIEMPDYPNHRRVPDGYDDEEHSAERHRAERQPDPPAAAGRRRDTRREQRQRIDELDRETRRPRRIDYLN